MKNMQTRAPIMNTTFWIGCLAVLASIMIMSISSAHKRKATGDELVKMMFSTMTKAIDSSKPVELGEGWYYLSSDVTNVNDTIFTIAREAGYSTIHKLPIRTQSEIVSHYWGGDKVKRVIDELGLTNGWVVFIK